MPAGVVSRARKPGVRLSETGVAFAGQCGGPVETAIAFAGEKWVFSVCFSVAKVSPVSTAAVQGRAVVMAVSRWPASVGAVVSLVSKLPRCRALGAKKFVPQRCRHRVGVTELAQRAHNTANSAFLCLLGELCRSRPGRGHDVATWSGITRPTRVE